MRKPRRDKRWDRTPGGLAVPRKPSLPTRRFIQKLGMTKCCCDQNAVGCYKWGIGWPTQATLEISGVVDGTTCECSNLNGTFVLDALLQGSGFDCHSSCYDGYDTGTCFCFWRYDLGESSCFRYLYLTLGIITNAFGTFAQVFTADQICPTPLGGGSGIGGYSGIDPADVRANGLTFYPDQSSDYRCNAYNCSCVLTWPWY